MVAFLIIERHLFSPNPTAIYASCAAVFPFSRLSIPKRRKEARKRRVRVTTEAKVVISEAIVEVVLGRVTVKDAGYTDVKDRTTYEIAKEYPKISVGN